MMKRSGISLITVLMFMLVATIAATATFKWLSSEGSSSADRLLMNEARASAVAGVEAARAWMTYHGNETGAVLRQFFDKQKSKSDGEKTAIRLDGVLAPMAKEGQSFSVSVVDVKASATMATYKVKIVSKGVARNGGAEYTEVAYLAVSGLYKVPLPQPEAQAPYHYAYFGGSTSYSGAHNSTAMIINGDWGYGVYNKGSNPGRVENDFIVTGNAALSGSDLFVGGTTCIGGNLNADNGFWGTDLYVDGNAVAPSWNSGGNKFVGQIAGNAYFNGDVAMGNQANPGFTVGGNMTLNGKWTTNLGSFQHLVGGDLCLSDAAVIDFQDDWTPNNKFVVSGNVYMPQSYNNNANKGMNKGQSVDGYYKRIFGDKSSSKVYIKDAFKADGGYCESYGKVEPSDKCYAYQRKGYNKTENRVLFFQRHMNGSNQNGYSSFTSNGTLYNVPAAAPFTCAKPVKAYCDSIWRPANGKGCDNSKYIVDDILTTAYESFKQYVDKIKNSGEASCSGIEYFSNDNTRKMNKCYEALSRDSEKAKKYLYNGFAVFSLKSNENASSETDGADAPKLNGKFAFIYEEKLQGNNPHFPRTESNARAFVYLRQGANTGVNVSDGTHINCQDNARGTHNYFIFTKGDIAGLLGECIWEGSFYATAASCAKIPDINGKVSMEYNESVVNDIFNAGLICANNGKACGKNDGEEDDDDDDDDDDGEAGDEEYDDMYVATGDHLMVTVESEYKNKEDLPENVADLEPSVMVYPRVIYLNQDARGKLEDYYTVTPLNGLKMTGTGSLKAVDAGAPPVTGKLLPNATSVLNQGIFKYTYTYTESSKKYTSDLHVVVMGGESETPLVHFSGDAVKAFEMGSAAEATISLVVEPSKGAGEFSVRIAVSDILSGWHVTDMSGNPVTWQTAADGSKYFTYTGALAAAGATINLFKIKVDSDATPGAVRFMMQKPFNCLLGGGTMVKTFNIKGAATIRRGSLKAYCLQYPTLCEGEGQKYKDMQDLQDCPDVAGEWVKINCVGGTTIAPNERWKCDAGVGNSNVAKLVSGDYDRNKCTLAIPTENNYVDNPQDDKSNPGGYVLYGELKRKAFRLKVDKEGTNSSTAISVKVGEKYEGPFSTVNPESCEGGVCTYVVYANQYFRLHSTETSFSRWHCHTCTISSEQYMSSPEYKHVMDKDFYITGEFNKKDDHCFYTEFENTEIWCSVDKIDCINYCDGLQSSCSMLDGKNGYKNPNWIAVNSRGGSDKKPSVKSVLGSSGYLTYSGTPLILLSSVDGGTEGSFTIRMSTDVISKLKTSELKTGQINSGVILRSNNKGTEYISVNFFGKSLLAIGSLVAGSTYARVCYVKDVVEKKDDNNCVAVSLKEKNSGILDMPWVASTQLGFTLTLEGDNLHISGSYSYSSKLYQVEGDVDLKEVVNQADYTLNDEEHTRVGLKLANSEFHVYDATWHSQKYGDECFADPRIFCSFTAKYMGGNVPLNEEVSPSVAFSSWFANKGAECMTKTNFYYNGCDLPPSSLGELLRNGAFCPDYCSDGLVENFIGNDGTKVSDGEYFFRCEGAHGFKHATRNGYVRSASLEVNCNTVNGQKYTASCGEFYVGEQHNCQQDEIIFQSEYPRYGIPGIDLSIDKYGKSYNLRDADLVIDVTKDPNVSISVRLVDENGNRSDDFNLPQGGENVIPYSKFSNRFGFNPEKVAKVVLKGTGGYHVKSVTSRCAHTLKVYCGQNDAMFDGGMWRIKANIQPFEAAKKCLVKAKNSTVSDYWFGDCNEAGEFYIEDHDFLDNVSESTEETKMDFEVSVFEDPDAMETSDPTSTCIASSQTYKPVTLTCDLGSDIVRVLQGKGVPALTFTAENCPSTGCDFDANLSNGTYYPQANAKVSGTKTWTAPVNVESALAPGSYSYQVTLYADSKKTKKLKQCTTPSFTVEEAKPASAYGCHTQDGRFYANIQGSNYEDVSATLVYTDMIGNPFTSQNVPINTSGSVDFDLSGLPDGFYTLSLMLNGKDAGCSDTYSKGSTGTAIKLVCPSDINGQDKNNSIFVSPKVTGCENSDCSYSVSPGTASTSGSNWNGGSFSFYDVNGSGTEYYTLKVSKPGANEQTCGFNVSFSSEAARGTCSVDNENVTVGSSVIFTLTDIRPNNENVKLEVLLNSNREFNDDNYWPGNSKQITFTMSSEGTYTITAKVNNSVVCGSVIKATLPQVDDGGSLFFNYNEEKTLQANKKYMVSCGTQDGSYRQFMCMTLDNTTSSFTYGSTTVVAEQGYWGKTVVCSGTPTAVIVPKQMKCMYTW